MKVMKLNRSKEGDWTMKRVKERSISRERSTGVSDTSLMSVQSIRRRSCGNVWNKIKDRLY